MRHVMLDLETWGTKPGSALRSIGAVAFELEGGVGESFYQNIDQGSCVRAGLTIDEATVAWWKKQSQEAQAALLINPVPLTNVVTEFNAFFHNVDAYFVWSQGGNFDEPLWNAATSAAGFAVPWKFWNARCTRTLYQLAGFDPRTLKRDGTHHNALDDALFQVNCVQASARLLRRATEKPSATALRGTETGFGDHFNKAFT